MGFTAFFQGAVGYCIAYLDLFKRRELAPRLLRVAARFGHHAYKHRSRAYGDPLPGRADIFRAPIWLGELVNFIEQIILPTRGLLMKVV